MPKGIAAEPTTILIAVLDSIKEKNLYQLKGLDPERYRFEIITTDSMGDSRQVVGQAENIRIHICPPRQVRSSALRLLIKILFTRRVHVAEVYPMSYLSLLIILLIKLRGIPVALIARGSVEYGFVTNQASPLRRRLIGAIYRLADYVIYKEPYMKEMLVALGKQDAWLLSNAVRIPEHSNAQQPGKCHFLFLNRMVEVRYPEVPLQAFLELCEELGLDSRSDVRLSIVGFLDERASEIIARREADLRAMVAGRDVPVELHPWTAQPAQWLADADVFLLPADVVYLNYSLLEAMARGVVPLIEDTVDSGLILKDGEEGYILPRDVSAWKDAMRRLILDPDLRGRLGKAARSRAATRFSLDAYLQQYEVIYGQIRDRKRNRFAASSQARQETQ